MNSLLYIIGVPGSGKSTLVAELVRGRQRRVRQEPVLHTVYEGGLVQLGRERAGRSGTDAMSMSIQPHVIAALEAGAWTKVIAEGDRLANRAFFNAATRAGYKVDVVLLDTPPEVAAQRCLARGSSQNATWLQGRLTKIKNLRPLAGVVLDGRQPVTALAHALALHPVLQMEHLPAPTRGETDAH